MTALLVVLGGALGAPARWWVDQRLAAHRPGPMPWGTLAVNVSGSFALGLLVAARPSASGMALLGIGLCGAFTTYSTFGYELVRLTEDGRTSLAARYLVLTLTLGLGGAAAGWALGAGLAG